MKPLLLFIEICGPVQWRPWYFRAPFKDGVFKRIVWLWFSIGWVRTDLPDYNRHVATGVTEWRLR
jgi:hypothetical protein